MPLKPSPPSLPGYSIDLIQLADGELLKYFHLSIHTVKTNTHTRTHIHTKHT